MDANGDVSRDVAKEASTVKQTQEQHPIRREIDSLDDFEHLGHDISPLKEVSKVPTADLLGSLHSESPVTRDGLKEINKGVETAVTTASSFTDELLGDLSRKQPATTKMDTNLLEMGDSFPDRKEGDEKLDKFLSELASFAPPVPKHQIDAIDNEKGDLKTETKNFMMTEKGNEDILQLNKKMSSSDDLLERYSDSEPEIEESNMPSIDSNKKNDTYKTETFKDVDDVEPELPKKEPSPVPEMPKPTAPVAPVPDFIRIPTPEQDIKSPEPVVKPPEPVIKPPEPLVKSQEESIKKSEPMKKPEPPKETKIEKTETKLKETVIEAEAMFCKMGLDAWFNPERLNPKVESLIYWRDPKKSGPVFGGVLVVLLALTYFSLISVIAYLSLLGLTGTISFRIYKNVVQAVQKTGDGHPFKEYLEFDLSLSQDKVKEISEVAVAHLNAAVSELRRLFLVEDLVDSIKFGVLLWCLTYLGAWFNGMTLIIITWVALFTLPKVYETNKTQIDANLEIVRSKLAEITSKVKAAIPIGKKAEEKKEQ